MPVLVVFVLGSLISVLRIVTANSDALTQLVWAEDGLFPLCIQANGYFQCLVDPYEGYFLFLSRTLAFPVAGFPAPAWPLATNIVAALSFGFLSSFITWLLLRAQVNRVAAMGSGLAAVLVPIIGLEAINTYGSAYMLLLIAAAITVSFTFTPRLPVYLAPTVLLISAITIPSSVILLLPLVGALLLRPQESRKQALVKIASLGVGLAIQFFFIVTATNSRSVEVTLDSVRDWIQQFPKALLTLLPTYSNLDGIGQIQDSIYAPNLWIGAVTFLALVVFAGYLVTRNNPQLSGAGWLVITGYFMGMIPAITGYPINRYFVIPIISVVIALFIWIAQIVPNRFRYFVPVIVLGFFILWLPDFEASQIRSTSVPPWGDMMSVVQQSCNQDPASSVTFTFSPSWPFPEANFQGPTNNVVRCDSNRYQ